MPQLGLFAADEIVLGDEARGSFVYTPGWLPPFESDAWFREILETVNWRSQRRLMYDREVDVPRLTAHCDLQGDATEVPAPLREIATRVCVTVGAPFNSVGLNRYRDGHDSVAPHNDHLDMLVRSQPIALVSLGATRRMTMRQKAAPRRSHHVDLEHGSLLVMTYATQLHYDHGIPKTAEPVGERISLAFRVNADTESAKEVARRRQYL